MHLVQLTSIDLNLLLVLHALYGERSVTGAARRLALSPSATSHALARLREVFGDKLLVRAGRRLVPTPRGEALVIPVRRVVAEMEALLHAPVPRDPRAFRRTFRVATTDHVEAVLLPPLDGLLRREAPGIDLRFVALPHPSVDAMRAGGVDLAIGYFVDEPALPDLMRRRIFEDQYVNVVRAGHPALSGPLTARRLAEHDFLEVTPDGAPSPFIHRSFAQHGLERRVARTMPTFLAAALLAAESDYVAILPARIAAQMLGSLSLRILRAPVRLPSPIVLAQWHRRFEDDPEHRWLRETVARAGGGLAPLKALLAAATGPDGTAPRSGPQD